TLAGGITVQGGSGNVKGYFSADSVINDGVITIPSGQTFTLGGTNNGTITATGTTLTLGGTNWVNNGTIAASGATVNLTRTLNNAGTTLTLSPGLGAWRLSGGTINGGTITSTNGSTLALS